MLYKKVEGGDLCMINLLKKDNLNIGILETDFDIFVDIIKTFSNVELQKNCLLDIEDYVVPEYFRNKMTLAVQTNGTLIGYSTFEFQSSNNVSQVKICDLFVFDKFKNKNMEAFLIEGVIYIAGEIGARNVLASVDEHDKEFMSLYQKMGFYEVGLSELGVLLSVNVNAVVKSRKLNDKFRDIPKDAIDYRDLKLVKKITSGRSSNIYLTKDGKILKMFTSTSFTYIKDREDTLKHLMKVNIKEIIKPKNLVYYDGVFVGYIMEYLPEGNSLWDLNKDFSFEHKIDKIKEIEKIIKKLHEKKIYMCDLNADNIFFDEKGNIKLIDCDAFVVKDSVINTSIDKKYQDPINKIVCEKTDLYAFGVTTLELFTNEKIDNNATYEEIVKKYNKSKNKLPESFKAYFDYLFKGKERYYLTESYEKYLNDIYNNDADADSNNKKGNISIIILSLIMVAIAVIGYFTFKG